MSKVRLFFVACSALLASGCGREGGTRPTAQRQAAQPSASQSAQKPQRYEQKLLDAEHLPNPWQIHPRVISGGLPEGDAAFRQLVDLGVKTVISVDGARPDVELARKHGMRYVHLPHGYDGISTERSKELAKAVRDLPGPVYIHCHHGKHRSPAAAAVACVSAGLIEPSAAEPFLIMAGTSASYKGLYESARDAERFESEILDEIDASFPETAELPPMAVAMVALEHTHEHLKQMAAAGWKSPPKHPDLEPAHEALLLREHFTELLRTDAVRQQPERFQALLRDSERDSQELENVLRAWKAAGTTTPHNAIATKAFDRITTNCKTCHTEFRDVPLSAKEPLSAKTALRPPQDR